VNKEQWSKINWQDGVIYLIHFKEKYKGAGHYLGYASDFEKRMERHRAGRGSNLIKVIQNAGIEWEVVRKWENVGPQAEAELKRFHNNRRLCPICVKEYAYQKAEKMRNQRASKNSSMTPKQRYAEEVVKGNV
jgi:predicted GIY-YIG superfamily endonuclease